MKIFKIISIMLSFMTTLNVYAQDANNNKNDESSQIIYAPQLSITKQDVENALNFISQSYVNINFKYQSGADNNLVQTEFFGSSKFLQGLGEINISQDGSLDYLELQTKILLYGDMRYYNISLHGTYTLLNEELSLYFEDGLDNLFYGISINNPVISLSYQNEHRTSLDKFSADVNLLLFKINNGSFISIHNSSDYIYQNKYVKVLTGLFVTTGFHAIGIEYTYKDLDFNHRVDITSLVYKIRL